jgi:hypothetical protein
VVTVLLIPVVLTTVAIFLPTNFADFLLKIFPQVDVLERYNFLARGVRLLWEPFDFLLPSGKNVVLVVWILAASLLASIRRRHRLPTFFFLLAVSLTILCILS